MNPRLVAHRTLAHPRVCHGSAFRSHDPYIGFGNTGFNTIDSPFTISDLEKRPIVPAPDLGQHSSEILRDAGYSEAEIAELQKAGTVTGR